MLAVVFREREDRFELIYNMIINIPIKHFIHRERTGWPGKALTYLSPPLSSIVIQLSHSPGKRLESEQHLRLILMSSESLSVWGTVSSHTLLSGYICLVFSSLDCEIYRPTSSPWGQRRQHKPRTKGEVRYTWTLNTFDINSIRKSLCWWPLFNRNGGNIHSPALCTTIVSTKLIWFADTIRYHSIWFALLDSCWR